MKESENIMIKRIIIILLVIAFVGLLHNIETTYKIEATVIDIQDDIVTVKDITNNIYQYKGQAILNDKVILIMNSNNTDSNRQDDMIIDIEH